MPKIDFFKNISIELNKEAIDRLQNYSQSFVKKKIFKINKTDNYQNLPIFWKNKRKEFFLNLQFCIFFFFVSFRQIRFYRQLILLQSLKSTSLAL